MRILVVEDNRILADAISQRMRKAGHGVDAAMTGLVGWEMLEAQPYDLIILDLNLPGISGEQLLWRLRQRQKTTPVLVLTARDQVQDRIQLLDLGADDYLSKPFDGGELEARCRALLRRSQGQAQDVVRHGNLELDRRTCRVRVGGEAVELKQREYRLLEVFLAYSGQVLSKEALLDHLYNFDESRNPNVIEIYVARLRKALVDSDLSIRTLRGLGYLLEKRNG
ncbi:response regulator transcription factor [Billgrantia aerodenitrificans]|uniref:Response regulator transcription factor n=1 Tax=Billgrantia aerodenitrificans TaxID=2733483 RepID=A0ABS9ANQ7_9GAMM|nr:response regulator transcription factor [Halomonas aerodenitrificans]MCE8023215.1 response regulator transcription factor [Halomonas aerodenitrificans]